MKTPKKVLIDQEDRRYFWSTGDFHSKHGFIKEKDLKTNKPILKSSLNHKFLVHNATFIDSIKKIRRGPAVPSLKDIGSIISHTGISKDSKIVDAGAGNGLLAAFLSQISNHVTSYEIRKDFFTLAKENLCMLNSNAKLKNKDIHKKIDEKNLDLITADLKDPWNLLPQAEKSLKSGAFFVSYLPNINQVEKLIKASKKFNFITDRILETIEREWILDEKRFRPKHHILGHTAFIVFLRKI